VRVIKSRRMRWAGHVALMGEESGVYIGSWWGMLTQYCAGDKIEKNEMGWACGAYG